jgi:hypothetical protein
MAQTPYALYVGTPDTRRTQDGIAPPWLVLHGTRHYEPFLSPHWRQQERLFQALRTGRISGPRAAHTHN